MLLTLIWGGNFVATKIALDDMPPLMLAGIRFGLGALVIGIWSVFNKIELRLRREELIPILILSLVFTIQVCGFNLGTKLTLAGRASVFMSINPFFVAIFAHFLIPGDRLNIKKLLGLILACCGIFAVFRDKIGINGSRITGDIILVFSALLVAFLTIYTKKVVQDINAHKLLIWQMIFGLPIFFGSSLIFETSSQTIITFNLIISLIYQIIIVTAFSLIVWTVLLKRYSASKLSVFIFAMPLFGVGFGNLMLQETITMSLITGAVLVAGGIYVVNKG